LAMVRASSDRAAVWLDQSWFVRWPYQFRAWTPADVLLRVAQRWSEKVDTTALYAALDDESQETFLRWAEGQPNSEETVRFLEALMTHYTTQGKRFIVLFWDRAPWHRSKQTRAWIRAYNQRAKREGLTRLIVCQLPTRSPWLMPLESIFGWVKHRVRDSSRAPECGRAFLPEAGRFSQGQTRPRPRICAGGRCMKLKVCFVNMHYVGLQAFRIDMVGALADDHQGSLDLYPIAVTSLSAALLSLQIAIQ
jgi:hypothetical protein